MRASLRKVTAQRGAPEWKEFATAFSNLSRHDTQSFGPRSAERLRE